MKKNLSSQSMDAALQDFFRQQAKYGNTESQTPVCRHAGTGK